MNVYGLLGFFLQLVSTSIAVQIITNPYPPEPTGTAESEEDLPVSGTSSSRYSSIKIKNGKITPNDFPWGDPMAEKDHEIQRANVVVHGDPLRSDELTVAIVTDKKKFNVSVRRSPTSILMEDVNMMELYFKSGQLKIKKERLPVDILEHSKHFFQDAEAGVAISVQKTNSQQMHVEGMVSDELFLLPPGDSVRHKRSVEIASHTLWKRNIPVSILDEVMGIPLPEIVRNSTFHRFKRHSHGSGSTPYIDVEVCVLIDYALYLKAGKNLRDLAAYMLHFWHAVNLRFATIKDMRINIKLKTVGVFQDEESQVFLKNNMLQGKKRVFEARHALSDLQRWLSYHYTDFSKFDVIFLLTGDDGCVFSGQACEKRVTGVSYVGGACRRHWLMGALNVAIGETDLVFRGVFTAAHEVGHLLGAPHDGEIGAEICTTNSGYLMSYNRSDPIKAHRFSICSINKFKEFLKTSSANCLWNRAVEPIPYPDVLPGQQMKLKDQCYNYVKGDPCEVSEFQCHHLCCYDEKRKYIFTREQPAVHGTDCGINSICYHGKCLSREKLSGLH